MARLTVRGLPHITNKKEVRCIDTYMHFVHRLLSAGHSLLRMS